MPPDTAVTPVSDAAPTEMKPAQPVAPAAAGMARRGGGVFVVDFQRDGNSAAHRTFGWSGQEQGHVWSVGASSGLRLPAQIDNAKLTVEMDFGISTGWHGLNAAVVRVFANGHPIGSGVATGWTRLRCDVPDGLIAPGEPIELRFEHPCFVHVDFLDLGHDDRALGLCVYAVRVYPPWMKPDMDRFAPRPGGGRTIESTAPPAASGGARSADPVLYRFSASDAGRRLLREGWVHDAYGDAWTDGPLCTLELPAPYQPGQYLARFTLCPLYIRNFLTSQRINILLAGAVIGQYATGTDTSLTIPLPPELYEPGRVLALAFSVPDAVPMRLSDAGDPPNFLGLLLESIEIFPLPPRHAALARVRDDDIAWPAPLATSNRFLNEPADRLPAVVKAACGVELAQIMDQFESLGDNSAFGLAQRKAGCEAVGLLGLSDTPLRSLMAALDDEFAAVAAKTGLKLQTQPLGKAVEYCLYLDRYDIRWHSGLLRDASDGETVFAQEVQRLAGEQGKFYDVLRAGRKIVTIARAALRRHPVPLPFAGEPAVWEERPERLRFAELLPLFLRLNEYGTNPLLYLTRCSHNRRPGTVELVAPGVMRGYVDDFVIRPELDNKDHATWLRVAVNAWLLDRGPNASFRGSA